MKNLYDDTIGDFHPIKWYAKKYHYSTSSIQHMTCNGLKKYKRGGITFISEEDFLKYMNSK